MVSPEVSGQWSECLDLLLEFDCFERFNPPFTQSDDFTFFMNGLIRSTIQYARGSRTLIHGNNISSADVVARSALEHALWAQFFYLHRREPDLIVRKYLVTSQSFLKRCKEDAEFFKFLSGETNIQENEFDDSLRELSSKLESLNTSTPLPSDSAVTNSLTTESGEDFYELVRIYTQMSQVVHPAACFFLYGKSENDQIEHFKDPQSGNPQSTMKALSRCCAWVLAIQEDLLKEDSHIEELIAITSHFGFQPWLKLSS